jgi:hypothetical protein
MNALTSFGYLLDASSRPLIAQMQQIAAHLSLAQLIGERR